LLLILLCRASFVHVLLSPATDLLSSFRFYSNTDSEVYRGSIREFCCQYQLDIIEVYKLVERKSPGSLVRHEYKKPRKTYEQSKETYKLSLLDKILDFFNFN
jgi:hypothetical protein